MARQYVDFDVNAILGELDLFQRKELPYAAGQALKQAAYQIAKRYLPQDMKDVFDRPVPRTLSSIKYEVKGLTATFTIRDDRSKGQGVAEYLYPVSTDDSIGKKAALTTRFTRGLRKAGVIDSGRWAVPFMEGRGVRVSTASGNMSPGQYQQVLSTITGGKPRMADGYRHFSIPDNRWRGSRQGKVSGLPEGVYRVKGSNDVQLLFTYARQQPKTKAIFDFPLFITQHAEDILPSLLSKSLQRAMGG